MMSAQKAEIIILKESVLSSWAKDGVTLGMLFVLPWFNHTYSGGSGWIFACIAFAWFITIINRATGAKKRSTYTLDQARAKLDEMASTNA